MIGIFVFVVVVTVRLIVALKMCADEEAVDSVYSVVSVGHLFVITVAEVETFGEESSYALVHNL